MLTPSEQAFLLTLLATIVTFVVTFLVGLAVAVHHRDTGTCTTVRQQPNADDTQEESCTR